MVYNDVISNNLHLILKQKGHYTKTDMKKVLKLYPEFEEKQARFIVLCAAIFYNAETSNYIQNYNTNREQLKRMIIAA